MAVHARAPARRWQRRTPRQARTSPMPRSCSARVDYASAAKDVNPAVQIFGPVNYGWQGIIRLPGCAPITAIAISWISICSRWRRRNTAGRRLVDVLDVHWYPEARGACTANPMDGCRITRDETTDAGRRRRAQAGAAQPLGPGVYRDAAGSRNAARAGRSACCRGSRTRSPLTIRARSWRSPSTTTAAAITSPAASPRPTCSASSAAKGCLPPRCGG